MQNKRRIIEQAAVEVAKKLTDEGKLVEAGFAIFNHFAIPKDAPEIQRREMQLAFMAGADHLFYSIMSILEPEQEPTENDLKRLDLISTELENWRGRISERIKPSQGRA